MTLHHHLPGTPESQAAREVLEDRKYHATHLRGVLWSSAIKAPAVLRFKVHKRVFDNICLCALAFCLSNI